MKHPTADGREKAYKLAGGHGKATFGRERGVTGDDVVMPVCICLCNQVCNV